MDEIEGLVLRAKQGDLRAFDELVRRFQNMAVGYAYSMLRDFGLAEDAAQDAFVQAFMDIGSLRQPKAFAGWLRRITFKYCQARLRRKSAGTVLADLAELPSRHAGPMDDGQKLTAFQLFERSCFEDPHIQFAKYKYRSFDLGWAPFERAGLVVRKQCLEAHLRPTPGAAVPIPVAGMHPR